MCVWQIYDEDLRNYKHLTDL
ncbi:MAG: hypothetical protein K6F44_03645 [Lachnospiraceae bacterium]|nr:hypothetical protein [Lachnospiraceae bacterium]